MATLLVINNSSNASYDTGDVIGVYPDSHEFTANEDPEVWDAQEEQSAQDVIDFNDNLPAEAPADAKQADYVKRPYSGSFVLIRNPGVPLSDFGFLMASLSDEEGKIIQVREYTLTDVNDSSTSIKK